MCTSEPKFPIITERASGAFVCTHGDEQIELHASSFDGAIREVLALGKPYPGALWDQRGQCFAVVTDPVINSLILGVSA